jgi:hypothetical protein
MSGSKQRPSHASDSSVQREAELVALKALSISLGVQLASCKLEIARGAHVHVDGFHAGPPAILAEVFAHQGPLKAGQRNKLMSDALKLFTASRVLFGSRAHAILVLTDAVAAAGIRSGWRRAALGALDVEVQVVDLPAAMAERVRQARAGQRMVNADSVPEK